MHIDLIDNMHIYTFIVYYCVLKYNNNNNNVFRYTTILFIFNEDELVVVDNEGITIKCIYMYIIHNTVPYLCR